MHPRRTAFARGKRKSAGSYGWFVPDDQTPPSAASPPHAAPPPPQSPDSADPSSHPSHSSASTPPHAEYLPGVKQEVLSTWFGDLHPTEKKDILTISLDELLPQLARFALPPPALTPLQWQERVAAVLQDGEYVTSVRRAFVNALHKEGLVEPASIAPCPTLPMPDADSSTAQLHPASRALLHVMAEHLKAAGDNKSAVVHITALALFYVLFISQLTALLRYPLALTFLPVLWVATASTAGPMAAPDPLSLIRTGQRAIAGAVLPLFDERVVRESVELCCSWVLLASWATYHSPRYFTLVCSTAALPLIVYIIDSRLKLSHLVRWPARCIASLGTLYVLYLSWYSYSTFLFTLLFFFPSVATIALSSGLLVAAAAFPLLTYVQSLLYSFASYPILCTALYALSTLSTLYYYFSAASYLRLALALFSSCLFLPPLLAGAMTVALSFAGQLVATHGLRRLLVMCGELAALVVLGGAVLALDWSLRVLYGWLDKRGWLGGSDGRPWALLRRLMESSAVKSLKEWLRRKIEASASAGSAQAGDGEG